LQGQLRLDISSVLVSNVVEDALETMLAAGWAISSQRLNLHDRRNIWGSPPPLQQVLCNLLANATSLPWRPRSGLSCVLCPEADSSKRYRHSIRPEFATICICQEKTASSNSHLWHRAGKSHGKRKYMAGLFRWKVKEKVIREQLYTDSSYSCLH